MKAFRKKIGQILIAVCVAVALLLTTPTSVYAASGSGSITELAACNDKLSVSWEASNNSSGWLSGLNGSCVTYSSTDSFIITSAAYGYKTVAYDTTVTVTLTNNRSNTMNLDFAVSGSTPTITAGSGVVTNSPSSGYSYTLDNGEYITIALTNSSTDAITTTISSIQFYSNEDVQITFLPSDNGSYALTVGGETVSVTAQAGPYGYSSLSAASVTPNSGYKFVGWLTSAGVLLDYTSGTNLFSKTSEDVTVSAYFVPTSAPKFQVGSNYYYYWADAFAASAANSNATVIMVESGTLQNNASLEKVDGTYVVNNGTESAPSLEYKVPSGFNLLIPYSATDTGDFDGTPDAQGSEEDGASVGTRSAYGTLTVSDGVTVTCAGSINVNAQQFATSGWYPGCVMAQYGHIKLNSTDAKLNVSGNLYCYGYITGTGSVEVTGKLYELMQVRDWRGGNAASSAISNNVFPFSQYYLQNVEADLIVYSSAKTYACVAIEAGLLSKSVNQTIAEYMGSGGFFQLGDGAQILREYDTTNDCMNYTLSGGSATMVSMELSLGDYSMNTESFIFPVTSNMNLTIAEGATITTTKAYKLLPDMDIVVNGTMIISGDIYIYDYADWVAGGFVNQSGANNVDYSPVGYIATTGKASARTLSGASASITVNGTLEITGGLYTTSDGNSSTDKVLKGTGTIEHMPANTASSIYEAESYYDTSGLVSAWQVNTTEISVSTALGNLAGVGKLKSFGSGTYYGLGADHDNYWYQTKTVVSPTCTAGGYTAYACSGATSSYNVSTGINAVGHTFASSTGKCIICGTNMAVATVVTQVPQTDGSVKIVYTYYETLANAVAAYDNTGYIQMVTGSNAETTINKTVYLDLNGQTVTNVTVSGTLYGMDSSSNAYEAPTGSITLTSGSAASYATVNNKRYLSIANGNTYTFHRVAVTVTGVQFLMDTAGSKYIIFRGEYKGAPDPVLIGVGFDFEEGTKVSKSVTTDDLKNVNYLGSDGQFMFGFGTSSIGITSVTPQMMFNGVTISGTIRNAVDNILTADNTSDVLTFSEVFDNFNALLQAIK